MYPAVSFMSVMVVLLSALVAVKGFSKVAKPHLAALRMSFTEGMSFISFLSKMSGLH